MAEDTEDNFRDEFWDIVRADRGLDLEDEDVSKKDAVLGENGNRVACGISAGFDSSSLPGILKGSTHGLFLPHRQQIIPWGSDNSAFNSRQGKTPYNTVEEFHRAAVSDGHQADPQTHPADISGATIRASSAVERNPLLRQYRLAYNTVNKFIYCENPGKVSGVCCAGLPINQIYKHLTQTAVRPTSDCIVHGYKITPADKANLEQKIKELYPDAPFTPADLQCILPLPGQVGPIVGVAPPIPGFICKQCQRGYRDTSSVHTHWKAAHKDVEKPRDKCFLQVPQMQSLSLHVNFIRYFPIIPDTTVGTNGPARSLASSDDMTLLSNLQEDVFGPDDTLVEVDSDAVLAFFRNSGATDHVRGLSPNDLLKLVGSPRENEPKLVKLRRAQALRFEAHCKRVLQGNTALRRLIVTTKL
jgi:hypothetical protein